MSRRAGRGASETGTGRENWEHEDDDVKGREGDGENDFPPGEHPLEGVANLDDLPAPEPLSAKVDLSEVGTVLYRRVLDWPNVGVMFCLALLSNCVGQTNSC